jgi:acyl-CoA reductase-like NAD-dependent aldehyde dehydrogenase
MVVGASHGRMSRGPYADRYNAARMARTRPPASAERPPARVEVRKTYKLYIGGAFPRTESGRAYPVLGARGELLANASRGTRKDIREAVRAARKAQPGWAAKTAYNRSQILYRIAELLEGRREQFVAEVAASEGVSRARATRLVDAAIDRWVWYAGWADKYHQVVGTVNPVAGPYFNFSLPEPTGVVGVVAPEASSLLGLVSRLAPVIVSGNAAVVIASESRPLPAVTLTEVLATSDVPGGVVNLVTGLRRELVGHLAAHMDVNAIDAFGADPGDAVALEDAAVENVKRFVRPPAGGLERYDFLADAAQSPYLIGEFVEIKTVWHPIGS